MISVIVPAYYSESTLEKCLKSIRESAYKNYELIVIDDGSSDATRVIAKKFADQMLEHSRNLGRSQARNSGIRLAKGDILLFIDSDVLVKKDTLEKVDKYFLEHKEVDALTGILSKEHPNKSYFSQYKNLYMNYIFSKLPKRIHFLYGSIHAVRAQVALPYGPNIHAGEDTDIGLRLSRMGKQIAFVKDLEVIHLKSYNFRSWVINDFKIPFSWARIFVLYQGWKHVGKHKTGYLHSPKEQLASVVLAPLALLFLFLSLTGISFIKYPAIFFFAVWLFLNLHFVVFLTLEKGLFFGLPALPVTFFDHLVMATGISCGLMHMFNLNKPGKQK